MKFCNSLIRPFGLVKFIQIQINQGISLNTIYGYILAINAVYVTIYIELIQFLKYL
jgi:hypothetical protein